ncbi:MAG: septum formation inhibitor Maf [Clostridia bacterium]|nr:septum formation inhibitor Maf [Clostridia bacterium]
MKLILASASQRRRELLEMCGYDFEIEVSRLDEHIAEKDPERFVSKLAEAKAEEVFARLASWEAQEGGASSGDDIAVLGSDTIVYHNGSIIGKPSDEKDAFRILSELSGKTHEVYTGVAVITSKKRLVECDITRVTFEKLGDDEIEKYIASGEPMDKAGAYGIQGSFGMFVQKVEGNYFTVIGLPLPRAYRMLKSVGVLPKDFRPI